MSELVILFFAYLAGGILGGVFFGGLWWTVRFGISSTRSASTALWFLGSLLLRVSIILSGFYFISGGNWARLLSCLAGFITARFIVTQVTRPGSSESSEVENKTNTRVAGTRVSNTSLSSIYVNNTPITSKLVPGLLAQESRDAP